MVFVYTRFLFFTSAHKHKIQWDSKEIESDSQSLFSENNTDIVVNKVGLYFLSSQVSFKRMPSRDNNPVRHKVIQFVNSTSEERVILEDSKPSCKFHGESHEFTSTVEAAFLFQQNDRVYVVVSHRQHVDTDNPHHHLSIHLHQPLTAG